MPDYDIGSTLLVGVGGIGCQIVDRVYAIAKKAGDLGEQNQLEILAFDTDVGDLGKLLSHIPPERRIQTSVPGTVREIFEANRRSFESWFLPADDHKTELMDMHLVKGAGQVRMLSRMAFDAALRNPDIKARIQRPVDRLKQFVNRASPDDVVNVMLVGSLAGGTGSGMFLQTALYLWQQMHNSNVKAAIRAVFLLPDIVVNATNIPETQHDYVRYNGYAALKELNAVQMASSSRLDKAYSHRFVFHYVADAQLPTDALPLKNVSFIDYRTLKGNNLGRNSEAYLSMAARTAYYLLFTPLGERERSVAVNDVRTKLEDPNNHYAGIGSYAVTYPRDDILDFLARRFAASILDDYWLKPDDAVRKTRQEWDRRVRLGEDLARLDDRVEYIREVDALADQPVAKRVFAPIRATVRPMVESDNGEKYERVIFEEYLDALEQYALEQFWSTSSNVSEARQRSTIEAKDLGSREQIVRKIQDLELWLRRDDEAIREALQSAIDRAYRSSLAAGEAKIAGSKNADPAQRSAAAKSLAAQHLHRHLFAPDGRPSGAMHPVAARYFLYGLQLEIEKRAKATKDAYEEVRKRVPRAAGIVLEGTDGYSGEIGAPLDTRMGAILDRARTAAESSRILSFGKFRSFQDDYAECFRETVQALREFAEIAARQRLYQLVGSTITSLSSFYGTFFDELRNLREELGREIDDLLTRHDGARGVSEGNVYVLADHNSKERIWLNVQQRLPGESGSDTISDAINRTLLSLHFDADDERNNFLAQEKPDLREEFRKKILNDVCRKSIEGELKSEWDFSIVGAIRRETTALGRADRDWFELFEDRLKVALDQAGPFIQLADDNNGTPVRFWSVAPALLDEAGDKDRMRELFKKHSGETPVEHKAFPTHTIVCLSIRINLKLYELRGVGSGDPALYGRGAVEGDYHRAYRLLLARLRDQSVSADPLAGRVLTPHLDRHWHQQGVLPEMHPAEAQRALYGGYDAFATGLALGWIQEHDRGGRAALRFDDPSRLGRADRYVELVDGTGLMSAFEALKALDGAVPTILAHAQRLAQDKLGPGGETVEDPHLTRIFLALTSPDPIARIARICGDRDPLAVDTAGRMIESLYRRLREYVLAHVHGGTRDELEKEVNDAIRAQSDAALEQLRSSWKASDAMQELAENVVRGTYQRLVSEKWADTVPA